MPGVANGQGPGSPATGIVVFVLGFVLLAMAVLGALPAYIPVWPAVAVAASMAVLGVAIAVKELSRKPPAPGPKPATTAFLERQRHALPTPPKHVEPTPPTAAAPATTPPPDLAASAPVADIDAQIQDLSREIGRARVMYGTGKISGEGYRAFVEDLEKRRGDLEARRARLLMGKDA